MHKVVVAIPCLLQGGTEMQSLYLCRTLIGLGYQVEVVCYFEFSTAIVQEFEQNGCTVTLLQYSRSISGLSFIRSFCTYLLDLRPDIVHVQYMAPGALPIIAAKLAGIQKIFATVHQPYTKSHGKKAMILLRTAALFCHSFTCVSLAVERSWFGSGQLLCDSGNTLPKHSTVYNTVNIQEVLSLASEQSGKSIRAALGIEKKIVIGYYGRMREEKGFDIFCKAFMKLYVQNNNLEVLAVGNGPQRQEMEDLYSGMAFWRAVKFIGEKPWQEAIPYLAAMDIVVIPSRFEGFGLSAVEAMAAKKPVVATCTGGLPEIVEDGVTGYIVEPESPQAIVTAVLQIAEDANRLARMSQAAGESAERFSLDKYHNDIKKLYLRMEAK